MTEPIAYLNGKYLPVSEAKLSIFDLGLVLGASVTEMIRTFAHQPFRLGDHIDRLFRSIRCVGFAMETEPDELRAITLKVLEQNAKLLPDTHDLGIVIFVTAGQNLTYLGAAGLEDARRPTVCVHTFPLPFELWAGKYETGQHLVTPSTRHIPPDSISPKIKTRSRMHWYLADRQAKLADPHAVPLLLDRNGNITETSTGNFFIVRDSEICTAGADNVLGGVSQQVVSDLSAQLDLEYIQTDLEPYDVLNADEAFTSSTPYCLLPVTRLNGQSIGDGVPGPVFRQLTSAWSELVGLDVVEQMQSGAAGRTEPQ